MTQPAPNTSTAPESQGEKRERAQPWRAEWPPKATVTTPEIKEGETVILFGASGGAYPDRFKESEGIRL